jgi:hypothetical protein
LRVTGLGRDLREESMIVLSDLTHGRLSRKLDDPSVSLITRVLVAPAWPNRRDASVT